MMAQPVAQGRDDQQPDDPVLEYAMAADSEDPGTLNEIFKKYGYQDDLMTAFHALHITFDPGDSFVDQLYRLRATGEAGV